MKRLYKKSVLILCSLTFAVFVFAQNIELPEVTTVISGETEKAELISDIKIRTTQMF